MALKLDIRKEHAADVDMIASITEQAFRTHPFSQHTEQFIIAALRRSGALAVSLVADVDGQVVGHIAFSPVQISDGSSGWYGLGPVAVAPEFQRRGIGTALVRAGMEELRRLGAKGCVLVGDPAFYERFGFRNHPSCFMGGVPQQYVLSFPVAGYPQAVGAITHHEAFHTRGPDA